MTAFFRAEAEEGGASDPDLLARQLILVFDGASARAGIKAETQAGLIAPTVTTLLDAAGVRRARRALGVRLSGVPVRGP